MTAAVHRTIPPDGGWGWMVILGTCLTLISVPMFTIGAGILVACRLEELGGTITALAVAGNLQVTVWSFVDLLMAAVAEAYGFRSATIVGGVLAFLTMALCSVAPTVPLLVAAFACVGGVAVSMSTFMGFILIPYYFDNRKGLANCLVASVWSLEKMAIGPLLQHFLLEYGYRWACLLSGAITLNTCVGGMLFQPPEWHQVADPASKEEKVESEGATLGAGSSFVSVDLNDDEDADEETMAAPHGPRPRENGFSPREGVPFVSAGNGGVAAAARDGGNIPYYLRERRRSATLAVDRRASLVLKGSMMTLRPDLPLAVSQDGRGETTCCAGLSFQKVLRAVDCTLLVDPVFYLLAVPNAIGLLAYLNLVFLLPKYLESLGYSPFHGTTALSTMACMELIFYLIFDWLSDFPWYPRKYCYMGALFLLTLSLVVVATATSFACVIVGVSIYGIGLSQTVILFIHLCIELLGVERLPQVIGFCSVVNGVVLMIGGPLVGIVRDFFDSYRASLLTLALQSAIGLLIWLVGGFSCCCRGRRNSARS